MKSAGVSEKFISRVLATPPKDMWFPTVSEMLKEGVITSESYGDRFAASWALSGTKLECEVNGLSKFPGFKAIQEVEPEIYGRMVKEFLTAVRSGKSEGEAVSSVLETCGNLMQKYIPSASDESLLELRSQWVGILKKYRQKNSRMCVAVFTKQKLNYSRAFPDWDMTNSLRVIEKVIRSGAGKSPVEINQKTAMEDIQLVVKPMAEKYGMGMVILQNQSRWMENSEKVCEMLLMMYEGMGRLPEKRAANLLRFLLTSKEEE
jgi:hypothetical protein